MKNHFDPEKEMYFRRKMELITKLPFDILYGQKQNMKTSYTKYFRVPSATIMQLVANGVVLLRKNLGTSYSNFDSVILEVRKETAEFRIMETVEEIVPVRVTVDELVRLLRKADISVERHNTTSSPFEIVVTGYEIACMIQDTSTVMPSKDYVKIMSILTPILKENVRLSVGGDVIELKVAGMAIVIDIEPALRVALIEGIARKNNKETKQQDAEVTKEVFSIRGDIPTPGQLLAMLTEQQFKNIDAPVGNGPKLRKGCVCGKCVIPKEDKHQKPNPATLTPEERINQIIDRLEGRPVSHFYITKPAADKAPLYFLKAQLKDGTTQELACSLELDVITQVGEMVEKKVLG